MITWHEVFSFFTDELGIPQNEVRCRVQTPYSNAPAEYDIQVYGETAIRYDSGFFWIPQFIEVIPSDPEEWDTIDIRVLGMVKCQGHWKDEFMKILPDFNKYIRQ